MPERHHPVAYVVADDDVAIPRAAQEGYVAAAGAARVAHQPMTSMPQRLAQTLADLAAPASR